MAARGGRIEAGNKQLRLCPLELSCWAMWFVYLRRFLSWPYITNIVGNDLSRLRVRIVFFVVKSAGLFIPTTPMWTVRDVHNVVNRMTALDSRQGRSWRRNTRALKFSLPRP